MKVNDKTIDGLARFECQDILLVIAKIICSDLTKENKAEQIEEVLYTADVIEIV